MGQPVQHERCKEQTCLCFGFFEQTMYTRPFLNTTLHPSHIFLTDERTFMPRLRTGIVSAGEMCWWCVCWCKCGRVAERRRATSGRLESKRARNMAVVVGVDEEQHLEKYGTAVNCVSRDARPQLPVLRRLCRLFVEECHLDSTQCSPQRFQRRVWAELWQSQSSLSCSFALSWSRK